MAGMFTKLGGHSSEAVTGYDLCSFDAVQTIEPQPEAIPGVGKKAIENSPFHARTP